LTGGKEVGVKGFFSGSCVLKLSDGSTLSLSNKDGKWYVRIPDKIDNFING
jgi:hypothetical protein